MKLKMQRIYFLLFGALLVLPALARADGMPEETPKKRRVTKQVERYEPPPPPPEPVHEQTRIPMETTTEEPCEWKFRLSPGMTIWFFDKESNLPGPAAALDVWRTDVPLNFHVGVEGRHMYLGQEAADFAREAPDKTTRITFIRIPFALEYMHPLAERVMWYAGLGPDIIHTANDLEDTNVGMHIGTRLHYAFDKHWGAAVEAGYMWGDVDGEGEDVSLDNAYITPTVSYTF